LVDYYLKKITGGITASDLPDTSTYANGLDEIEEALTDEDFNGVAVLAKDTAYSMLEEEGYGLDENKNNVHINETNNKTKTKEGMKRLKFKTPFNGVGNALKLIPESYRVNNKTFEMTDGNENYKIRWEGSLTEGKAVVLMASDKNLVNEDIQKMKHLMGFKSENTLGLLKGKQRLDENSVFIDIFSKTKSIMTETEDMEGANAKEGDWDKQTKKAKESTKHVKGSVKKDSMIAKGKEGNPDKAVSHAPEAKKPMKSSTGKNIESQETPSEGHWEDSVNSQAPEAKKHVHLKEYMEYEGMNHGIEEESIYEEMDEKMLENMLKQIQMEEDYMENEGMNHDANEMVYEIEMEDDEDNEDVEEPKDDSIWNVNDNDGDDDSFSLENEPTMSDIRKNDTESENYEFNEDIKLLLNPKTGEYYIKKDGELIKVSNKYLSIASDKNIPGYQRAEKIYNRIKNDSLNIEDLDEV
jgi:hypothetical protein